MKPAVVNGVVCQNQQNKCNKKSNTDIKTINRENAQCSHCFRFCKHDAGRVLHMNGWNHIYVHQVKEITSYQRGCQTCWGKFPRDDSWKLVCSINPDMISSASNLIRCFLYCKWKVFVSRQLVSPFGTIDQVVLKLNHIN